MRTILLSLASLMIGILVAVGGLFVFRGPVVSLMGETTDKNTQIVNAVTRTQEVALVTLGIEGIRERKTEDGQILFLSIPNSRAAFLRYSFDAKLGFNAEDADVDEQPDGSFLIRVPAFTVIGLNNQKVEVAAENNDLLSWTTPEIDKVDMVNDVFDIELQAEYLEKNAELLEDQTRVFYTGIVTAIDPDAKLTFEFTP